MKQKYEVLLFDADGTLLDLEKAERAALEATCNHFNLPYDANILAIYKEKIDEQSQKFEKGLITRAEINEKGFEEIFKVIGVYCDLNACDKFYVDALSKCNFLYADAKKTCAILAQNYKMYIITNGTSKVIKNRFATSELASYFENIFTSEDIGAQKPNLEFFAAVFNEIQLTDLNKTLIIGDSLSTDIQGGINAKMDTCWYNPDGKENTLIYSPTYTIKKLADLLNIL